MFRAAADGLHRPPHVASLGQEVPPGRDELVRIDASGLVHELQGSLRRVVEDDRPDLVAVALDDRVRAAEALGFFGIERRVDAAVDDGRALGSRLGADFVSAEGVAGVDAETHHVAGLHGLEVERFERLISNARIAVPGGSGPGQDEQPSGCDDAYSKGKMTRVDQVNGSRTGLGRAWYPFEAELYPEIAIARCSVLHTPLDGAVTSSTRSPFELSETLGGFSLEGGGFLGDARLALAFEMRNAAVERGDELAQLFDEPCPTGIGLEFVYQSFQSFLQALRVARLGPVACAGGVSMAKIQEKAARCPRRRLLRTGRCLEPGGRVQSRRRDLRARPAGARPSCSSRRAPSSCRSCRGPGRRRSSGC